LIPACATLLERRGFGLGLLKSHSVLKISCTGCFGLSPDILVQFTLEMPVGVAARNCEKFTKTHYFWGSRSFKVIDVDISKKLVASACYDKQHVRAYLQPFSRQMSLKR